MRQLTYALVLVTSFFTLSQSFASTCGTKGYCPPKTCEDNVCCGKMGGVSYCDSSAGRLVCNNGYYSSCYCTRHAVMDLQLLQGCCLWRGGVLTINVSGIVICNDGTISEECSLQNMENHSGVF